jgi:phenylacetic acid degradation operon negative regulatory protein
MHARSALFDVYGDHLRRRGGRAPISALVALLEPLGIAAPAVRTAVSRMVRQGWLSPTDGRGYALTARGARRMEDSATRIYRTADRAWHGELDMVLFAPPTQRRTRSQLTAALRFWGYAPLAPGCWISPWPANELDGAFAESGVDFERFGAAHRGDTVALVRRAWDLDALSKRYRAFVSELEPVVAAAGTDDSSAYAARFRLVHEFRVFLFSDPQLPEALRPPDWEGDDAAAFFDTHAARLRPAADRFVDSCLDAK